MSVREKSEFLAPTRNWAGLIPASLDEALEQVFGVFPRLRERANQLAGSLSGGEAQMVAVGRALMSRPSLTLVRRAVAGAWRRCWCARCSRRISRLRDTGITVLLADQNARSVLRMADRAYVLDTGRVVASGSSAGLADDQRLWEAYLGSGVDARI